MSNIGSYTSRSFSENQKFLVLDPSTGTTSLVLGSDLVSYITPQLNAVNAESTRLAAENTDYAVGEIIQTTGATSPGDNFAAVYLVVEGGTGDFPMINGNDLLVIRGDEFLREQLAENLSTGNGATLVNGATIYVGSVAELEALALAVGTNVYFTQEGRSGEFVFKSSDLSASVTADPLKAFYVAPSSDPTGASGAFERVSDVASILAFGAQVTPFDSSSIVTQAIATCDSLGKQLSFEGLDLTFSSEANTPSNDLTIYANGATLRLPDAVDSPILEFTSGQDIIISGDVVNLNGNSANVGGTDLTFRTGGFYFTDCGNIRVPDVNVTSMKRHCVQAINCESLTAGDVYVINGGLGAEYSNNVVGQFLKKLTVGNIYNRTEIGHEGHNQLAQVFYCDNVRIKGMSGNNFSVNASGNDRGFSVPMTTLTKCNGVNVGEIYGRGSGLLLELNASKGVDIAGVRGEVLFASQSPIVISIDNAPGLSGSTAKEVCKDVNIGYIDTAGGAGDRLLGAEDVTIGSWVCASGIDIQRGFDSPTSYENANLNIGYLESGIDLRLIYTNGFVVDRAEVAGDITTMSFSEGRFKELVVGGNVTIGQDNDISLGKAEITGTVAGLTNPRFSKYEYASSKNREWFQIENLATGVTDRAFYVPGDQFGDGLYEVTVHHYLDSSPSTQYSTYKLILQSTGGATYIINEVANFNGGTPRSLTFSSGGDLTYLGASTVTDGTGQAITATRSVTADPTTLRWYVKRLL